MSNFLGVSIPIHALCPFAGSMMFYTSGHVEHDHNLVLLYYYSKYVIAFSVSACTIRNWRFGYSITLCVVFLVELLLVVVPRSSESYLLG